MGGGPLDSQISSTLHCAASTTLRSHTTRRAGSASAERRNALLRLRLGPICRSHVHLRTQPNAAAHTHTFAPNPCVCVCVGISDAHEHATLRAAELPPARWYLMVIQWVMAGFSHGKRRGLLTGDGGFEAVVLGKVRRRKSLARVATAQHPHALRESTAHPTMHQTCASTDVHPSFLASHAHERMRARVPACISAHRLHRRRQVCELRGACMTLPDELAARIPLAYVHFTAFLVDALLFLSPLALVRAAASRQTTATTYPPKQQIGLSNDPPAEELEEEEEEAAHSLQTCNALTLAAPRRAATKFQKNNSCLG